MGDDDLPQRRRSNDRFVSVDRGLQTVGGILLSICAALTWRSFNRIDEHEGRIIRVEEKIDTTKADIGKIDARLEKIDQRMERIAEAVGAKKP